MEGQITIRAKEKSRPWKIAYYINIDCDVLVSSWGWWMGIKFWLDIWRLHAICDWMHFHTAMRPIRPDYNPFYHTRLADEKELDISISHAGLNIIVPWMTCYSIHRLMELPQTMFYNILHLQDLIND